ncbi:MAG: DNA polymerase IV [Acutalibacteraceae bacterium]
MSRVILHSDCNSFYASVECLHNPQIRSKPVAVSGNADDRHGIILAKNENAKKYGVKTGETIWQAKQKCPDLVTVEPHFDQYKRFSKLARSIYLEYTDRVEPFGLDEAWLDVTDFAKTSSGGVSVANEINKRVREELGITVSIGVSFNKIFAKLGSDYRKPDAITEFSPDNYKDLVWNLPCDNLLYVGRSTKKKLLAMGIYTIGDIARTPINILSNNLGKWGEMLYCFANGQDTSPVSVYGSDDSVKSIGNSTTCPRDLKNREDVKIVFQVLADSVARRLREIGMYCRCVSISVRDNKLCSFTRQQALERSTNITSEIFNTAMELFDKNYNFNIPIRSIGISLSMLNDGLDNSQLCIFDNFKKRMRLEDLDRALDGIKNRFGSNGVFPASALLDTELSGFDPKVDHVIHPIGYF